MAQLTKTLGGLDPWTLPSGGVLSVKPKTRKNEKAQIHRAIRREAKREVTERT